MSAKVNIEWVIGVLRCGENLHDFGDPYEFSCTVVRREDVAEIIGASGKMPTGARREILATLKAQGIKKVVWTRDKSKGKKDIIINL